MAPRVTTASRDDDDDDEEKKVNDDDHAQHDMEPAPKVQCSFGAPTMRTTTKAPSSSSSSSSSMTPNQVFDKRNAIASMEEVVHASIVARTAAATHSSVGTQAVVNRPAVVGKEENEDDSNDFCGDDDSSCPRRPLENGEGNENDTLSKKHYIDSDPSPAQEAPATSNGISFPVVWLEEDDDNDNDEFTQCSRLALEVEIVPTAFFQGKDHYYNHRRYDDDEDLIIAATTTPIGAVVVVPGSPSCDDHDDENDDDNSILHRHRNSFAIADASMDFTETNRGLFHHAYISSRTTAAKRGCWCAWLPSPKATKSSAVEWKTTTTTTTASSGLRPSRSTSSVLTQEF